MNWLRELQRGVDALESVVLDVVAGSTPWLAPIIPAWLTFEHSQTRLGFPVWLAMAAALAVECLGLSTIHTSLQFWNYNETKRQVDAGAPFWVAIIAAIFYLAIIVVVNIILDTSPAAERLAKALLSLISVVAGVTLALRAQHKRRLADMADRRVEEREERAARRREKLAVAVPPLPVAVPMAVPVREWQTKAEFLAYMANANGSGPKSAEELKARGVPHRTAYRWWGEWKVKHEAMVAGSVS